MKKQIIIAGLVSVIMTPPASAVTKCVALNSSTTCTSNYDSYYNKTDWAATCTTNGVITPISGIGICSSTSGDSIGQTATELDTSFPEDENMHCWCKMTSPAVSRWVFPQLWSATVSANECSLLCAYSCAANVLTDASFMLAMFNSLSD